MYFYTQTKAFISKLLAGGFGLPVTFWLFGVLFTLFLDFSQKNWVATKSIFLVFVVIVIFHLYVITVAVWNAAKKYKGHQFWAYAAKAIAVIGVIKWVLAMPDLIVGFLSVIGITTHSSEYWELDVRNLTCQPALYQYTPERMERKYQGCVSTKSSNGEVINLRCRPDEINAEFFYTRNLNDCNKYLAKLQVLRKVTK